MADRSSQNIEASLGGVVRTPSGYLRSRRKRFADILFAVFGLIITLVMLPFIALAIKMDSRGTVFYKQTRLGLDGSSFDLIKFRTMVNDAENVNGPAWAVDNDPRITRVGRVFRALYIDEFPQWWNVLQGDMSVVGPRPERPEFTKLIAERYPKFPTRLEAKPGITGLAQTEYHYTKSVAESRHKLNYDQRYISHASLTLDIWVVLRTFRRMLLRTGT
jgi:lipopolysaccharide/colanic/teichoic acid biosynthesis glycosyltransferase